MSDSKIEVSASALRELLAAVTGPSHHIRELQVTMNMPFGEPNCIEILVKEFNDYANQENSKSESS